MSTPDPAEVVRMWRASLEAGQRRAARLATQALTPAAELLAAGSPEHDRVLEALSAGDP